MCEAGGGQPFSVFFFTRLPRPFLQLEKIGSDKHKMGMVLYFLSNGR